MEVDLVDLHSLAGRKVGLGNLLDMVVLGRVVLGMVELGIEESDWS